MTTIVITGANRGIGLALTQLYLAAGDQVIALCRHTSPALSQTQAQVIEGVDVGDASTLTNLASTLAGPLQGKAIDILINNAGILREEELDSLDYDDMLAQYRVNALGPLMVSNALLGLLKQGSKIAVITSRMGSISDNTSGGYYGYRMSKAALNAGATSLAVDLKPRGIAVGILHPGFVQTEMVNGAGNISAEEAARGLIARIAELTLATSGSFRHSDGQALPW
ncbi:SDR family oxidoreductase [Halioxenophilus sp. WMMB6]|uniref:SDR family oxidoreductase n=1 Tax=Halioxenophilus sp. WMMB6 TaxID=3073815 RepID=UPI00295EC4A0|nr:SDR family oxidoreductase [Halioxenophilus sp. WMMB6]